MYFGAKLVHAATPMHGKVSVVQHNGHPLFHNIPSPFTAMRYHSLAVTVPEELPIEVMAGTEDGTIMALCHKQFPCIGVQFHPESVGTRFGLQLLKNWAQLF